MTFLVVRQAFVLVTDIKQVGGVSNVSGVVIDFLTAEIIFYFSYRFLRGFVTYYFGGESFREKMRKWSDEIVAKEMKQNIEHPSRSGSSSATVTEIPFSVTNSLPVFSITMTEGFEASLVLSASAIQNLEFTIIGALIASRCSSSCVGSHTTTLCASRVGSWSCSRVAFCSPSGSTLVHRVCCSSA